MADDKLHNTVHTSQRIYEDALQGLGELLSAVHAMEKRLRKVDETSSSTDIVVSSHRPENIAVARDSSGLTHDIIPESTDLPDFLIERVVRPPQQAPSAENRAKPSLINEDPIWGNDLNDWAVKVEKQAKTASSSPTRSLRPETGVLYSATAGKAVTDHLTKEDAAAVAAMLKGKVGDSIPDAANLKITVNGQVIAEADAYGNLTRTNASQQSPGLSQHFSALATEEKRPSNLEGVEKLADIAARNPEADGHQFMQQLANNFEALHSPDMSRVVQRQGLSAPTLANATAIMNLYATKEPDENSYQLKDGGLISSRSGTEDRGDYQFFEVTDVAGNVDMAFTVCPNGMILVDPKISSVLQSQISLMAQAWDQGLYNDDTPLMSQDKVRADAVFAFKQNVTAVGASKKSDLVSIKTDKQGNLTVTANKNPIAKFQLNKTKEGGLRIHANSLSTPDILEFNRAFAVQSRNQDLDASQQTKTQEKAPGTAKKPVKTKKHRNQPSM